MEINALSGSSGSAANVEIIDADKTGFAGLNAETFMKLLIAELQNQDPLEPVGNEELVGQLSAMRSLSANIELGDALKELTTNRQLTDGASFLGALATGLNEDQEEISGIVDRAVLRDGTVFLGIGEQEMRVSNVTALNHIFPDSPQ